MPIWAIVLPQGRMVMQFRDRDVVVNPGALDVRLPAAVAKSYTYIRITPGLPL